MREISSSGIEKKSNMGATAFSMKSMAPDDVRASMAMNIPMINGRISTHVPSPSLAPSIKTS